MERARVAPLVQGVFYIATGLWPVVHLRSFEAVSGPKADRWLVRTTGALITAVGVALASTAIERLRPHTAAILGIGAAVALGGADVLGVVGRRISRVYLGDAVAEAGVAALYART